MKDNQFTNLPTLVVFGEKSSLIIDIVREFIKNGGAVISLLDSSILEEPKLSSVKSYIAEYDKEEFLNTINRKVDYVILNKHLFFSEDKLVTSSEFLEYSGFLKKVLDFSLSSHAKFELISSLFGYKNLMSEYALTFNGVSSTYRTSDIQRIYETTVAEFNSKLNLNASIVRVGEVIGEMIEAEADRNFNRMVSESIKSKEIRILGDGLRSDFYVNVLDASSGCLKALFSENSNGSIYILAYDKEIRDLSIAYKISELSHSNAEIKFIDSEDLTISGIDSMGAIDFSINEEIGWEAKIPLERSIIQSIENSKSFLSQKEQKIEVKPKSSTKLSLQRPKTDKNVVLKSRSRNSKIILNQEVKDHILTKELDLVTRFKLFVRSITILKLLKFLSFLFLFGLLYLFILAPFIKNLYLIYDINKNINLVNNSSSLQNQQSHESIYLDTISINHDLDSYSFILNELLKDQYESFRAKIVYLSEVSRVAKDSTPIVLNYSDFFDSVGYTITNQGNNLEFKASEVKLPLNIKGMNYDIQKTNSDLSRLELAKVDTSFPIIGQKLNDYYSKVSKENFHLFKFISVINPDFSRYFGINEEVNYIILVKVDSSLIGYVDVGVKGAKLTRFDTVAVSNNLLATNDDVASSLTSLQKYNVDLTKNLDDYLKVKDSSLKTILSNRLNKKYEGVIIFDEISLLKLMKNKLTIGENTYTSNNVPRLSPNLGNKEEILLVTKFGLLDALRDLNIDNMNDLLYQVEEEESKNNIQFIF